MEYYEPLTPELRQGINETIEKELGKLNTCKPTALVAARRVQQAKRGEKPKAKVDECYNGWRNHAAKGNSTKLLRRMDKYYKDLWKGEA